MIVSLDARLNDLVDANVEAEQIATGFRFTEGPVWDAASNSLLFCDVRTHRIHRWSRADGTSVFREYTNSASGNTFDPQGRLLTCESRTSVRDGDLATDPGRRVTRTNADGSIEIIAERYNGGRLSSPNDLICLANGDIIFTDPPFGLRHGDGSVTPRETDCNGVYRIKASDGSLELVTGAVDGPNGLVVRQGLGQLLVAHTRAHNVEAFDLDGTPRGEFCDLTHGPSEGHPDGMKLDSQGNLYIAANTDEGVWVYDPEGKLLGFINTPERPANLAWGDEDWQTLYVTALTSVYRIPMKVRGQQLNPS